MTFNINVLIKVFTKTQIVTYAIDFPCLFVYLMQYSCICALTTPLKFNNSSKKRVFFLHFSCTSVMHCRFICICVYVYMFVCLYYNCFSCPCAYLIAHTQLETHFVFQFVLLVRHLPLCICVQKHTYTYTHGIIVIKYFLIVHIVAAVVCAHFTLHSCDICECYYSYCSNIYCYYCKRSPANPTCQGSPYKTE